MSLGINSLLSNVDDKMKMFRANPEQAMQRAKITGSTLDAIAAEKVLSEKQAAANELQRQLMPDQNSIASQNDQALQGMAVQELAKGIGQVFQVNQARKQKNLNKVANMGLAGAPVQRRMGSAQGGIVGYQAGKDVKLETEEEKQNRRSPLGIILGDLKKKIFGDDTDSGTFTANRPEVGPAGGVKSTLPLADQRALGQGVMQTYPQGAGIGPETTDEDFQSQLAAINKPLPSQKPAFTGPKDPTELFDQIDFSPETGEEPAVEPPSTDDTPEKREELKSSYGNWFKRLLTVLSAPPTGRGLGGGNRARALLQYEQRVFENDLAVDKLEIEENKAKALNDLNKLEAEKLEFTKLAALQTKVLEAIDKISKRVDDSFLGIQYKNIERQLAQAVADDDVDLVEKLQKDLKIYEKAMASAVRKAAQAYQGPLANNGLLSQLAALEELLLPKLGGTKTGAAKVPGFQNTLKVLGP